MNTKIVRKLAREVVGTPRPSAPHGPKKGKKGKQLPITRILKEYE